MSATDVTARGIANTYLGSLELLAGDFYSGVKRVVLGSLGINSGGNFLPSWEGLCGNIVKVSLLGGIIKVTSNNLSNSLEAIKKRSPLQIIRETTKATVGIASSYYILTADPKTLEIASQGSVLAFSGATVIRIGSQDISKGHYARGIFKVLLGAGGVASAVYYVSSHVFNGLPPEFEANCNNEEAIDLFIEKYKPEILSMHKDKKLISNGWNKLGAGESKKTLEHPELPGCVIKIGTSSENFWGNKEPELVMESINVEKVRAAARNFEGIVIPNTHLRQISTGSKNSKIPVLFQDKFDLIPIKDIPIDQLSKGSQLLMDLIKKTRLCSVYLARGINSGFLRDGKIAIYDFDCKVDSANKQAYLEVLKMRENKEIERRKKVAKPLALLELPHKIQLDLERRSAGILRELLCR